MIDQKIYFVCYHAGAGGQFISALTEILLTGDTVGRILPNGAVNGHIQREQITNFIPLLLGAGSPYQPLNAVTELNNNNNELFKDFVTKIKIYDTHKICIIPTHLICINSLLNTFTNAKIIAVYPTTADDIVKCREIWANKNTNWHPNAKPHHPFKVQQILDDFLKLRNASPDSARLLNIDFSEVHNQQSMHNNIVRIDNFVNGDKKYIEIANEFYASYLKNQ